LNQRTIDRDVKVDALGHVLAIDRLSLVSMK
jgi:hypothetical protein